MRLADAHDVLLLDLDGVVYVGPHAVPGAVPAIERALAEGLRCAYVTNNASRTPDAVAEHLRALGIPASDDEVVTSSQAGATLIAERIPAGSEVLAVGGDGVAVALAERGFTVTRSLTGATRAVLQGFGPHVGWADLAEATAAVRAGLLWIATNPDLTFPTPRGPAPGNGALVRAVATAAGRDPDAVAGKPERALLDEAVRRAGAVKPLMIGDRLDTDIAAGNRIGMPTLLVLTGICSAVEAAAATGDERPTYIGDGLGALWDDRV